MFIEFTDNIKEVEVNAGHVVGRGTMEEIKNSIPERNPEDFNELGEITIKPFDEITKFSEKKAVEINGKYYDRKLILGILEKLEDEIYVVKKQCMDTGGEFYEVKNNPKKREFTYKALQNDFGILILEGKDLCYMIAPLLKNEGGI